MAIAFDNASYLGNVSSGSFTCTGSNRMLFVSVTGDVVDNQPIVTYNSVTMTLIAKDVSKVGERYIYLFYLINPASGSNTVASSGSTVSVLTVASYTGVKQSSQPDNSTHGAGTGGTVTFNLTPVASGCWAISTANCELGGLAGSTGVTERAGSGGGTSIGDSNGTISGSTSMTWTSGGGGTMAGIMASFAPVASANGNFLMFMK